MILIIDDDSAIRSSLGFMLKRSGYDVTSVASPEEAIDVVRFTTPELILMDMNFSLATDGEEGLTLLKQIKIFRPEVPVILMTAWGSIQLAVKGMKAGAFDFITKPWNNITLMQRIETALEVTTKLKNKEEKKDFDRSFIIGKSKALMNILNTVKSIAGTDASVLITGESGTGKELIAEAIHKNSRRAKGPFIKVNLGGISHTLFESEMFGHKKGAFTDAVSDRTGRFEMANKGTIFLDEIGELDIACQVKILRVLQEQTFEPLGESKPHHVDIRVICATNANLQEMLAAHTFREDLYYRINLITLHLPALRERREDIPELVRYFSDLVYKNYHKEKVEFTSDAIEFLCRLPYPGNIRELKNLIEHSILICNNKITAADLHKHIEPNISDKANPTHQALTLDELERNTILQTLDDCNNSITATARTLGISRAALYRKIEKYKIKTDK